MAAADGQGLLGCVSPVLHNKTHPQGDGLSQAAAGGALCVPCSRYHPAQEGAGPRMEPCRAAHCSRTCSVPCVTAPGTAAAALQMGEPYGWMQGSCSCSLCSWWELSARCSACMNNHHILNTPLAFPSRQLMGLEMLCRGVRRDETKFLPLPVWSKCGCRSHSTFEVFYL